MDIIKLGGTSLSSKISLENIVKVIEGYNLNQKPLVVVVSAINKVTNNLLLLIQMLMQGDEEYLNLFETIKKFHSDYVISVFPEKEHQHLISILNTLESEMQEKLHLLAKKPRISEKEMDQILCFGEIFSAHIISAFLKTKGLELHFLDARKLIVTDDYFGNARVIWNLTHKKINDFFADNHKSYVITGYIGATIRGETTTLGRGGSDYTAAILAISLKVRNITKWTDVNGIMTADPRLVLNARPLGTITFKELLSLSRFTSNILVHPKAIRRLSKNNLPFLIRNIYDLEFSGTQVSYYKSHLQNALSVNPSCKIIEIHHSKDIRIGFIKLLISKGLLLFRLNARIETQERGFFYLLSDTCYDFVRERKDLFKNKKWVGPYPEEPSIILNNVALVTVTNQNINKKKQLEKIELFLAHRDIELVGSRIFKHSVCLVLRQEDSIQALNLLHEELNGLQQVEPSKNSVLNI